MKLANPSRAPRSYNTRRLKAAALGQRHQRKVSLRRSTTAIPNRRDGRVLEVEDRSRCFRKLEAMHDLVPARRHRRRAEVQPLPEQPLGTPGVAAG